MQRIRPYIFYVLFCVVSFVVAHLPINATWPLFKYMAKRAARPQSQSKTLRANMIQVTGAEGDELQEIIENAYVSYALYWHELFRITKPNMAEVPERVHTEGLENLDNAVAQGKGVILAVPHVGNWEIAGAWFTMHGTPAVVVAEMLKPKAMFNWFVRVRAGFGATALALSPQVTPKLIDALEKGKVVGLLCDRNLTEGGVEVEFFGKKTSLPGGPAVLAKRSGAPIIPTAGYLNDDRTLTLVFGEPINIATDKNLRTAVKEGTQEITTRLEQFILRSPYQWHMFQQVWDNELES